MSTGVTFDLVGSCLLEVGNHTTAAKWVHEHISGASMIENDFHI